MYIVSTLSMLFVRQPITYIIQTASKKSQEILCQVHLEDDEHPPLILCALPFAVNVPLHVGSFERTSSFTNEKSAISLCFETSITFYTKPFPLELRCS